MWIKKVFYLFSHGNTYYVALVAQPDAYLIVFRRSGIQFCQFRQLSFMEIDPEIYSTVSLSLTLIQEGQASVR